MLHKTDNLILADCILRLLRLDKRLKPIDGLIKPYINNDQQGFTVELLKFKFGDIITFAVEKDGKIVVYIYHNVLELLDNNFQDKKEFSNDSFIDAKEYITNALITLIKNAKIKKLPYELYSAL
ncbi:hypothetical protein [Candidatus Clostridium radicumherbarum]|uniref:Uncharacterized protein n=1 Tax=Candidatus Clostridium radicumherbarum TaxID=3381662 RepID=A0ABW8TPR0_9CLOT